MLAIRAALLAIGLFCSGCSPFVQYSDEISDSRSGRTLFVTTPAELGGSAGFLVGLPAVLIAFPLTYSVYRYQDAHDPIHNDPLSTLLFPSFVCWRVGKMLGAPFDFLEFVTYRVWRGEESLTREERETIEFEYDQRALPCYPVETIYPDEQWLKRARAAASSD